METTQEYLAQLLALRRQIRLALPLCIIGFLLAALFGMTTRFYTAASVGVVAVVAVYLVFTRRKRGQYLETLNRAAIEHGLCQPLSGAQYLGKNGLTQPQFEALALLPIQKERGALLCHHAFAGRLGKVELSEQEVTFHYEIPAPKGRSSFRFCNGTLLTAALDIGARGDWLVLHKNLLPQTVCETFVQAQGYSGCRVPAELEEEFLVYARNPGGELSEELAAHLAALNQNCRSLGAVRLSPEGAAVFLNNVFYSGGIYGKKEPEEQALRRNNLPERDEIWRFFRFWAAYNGN